MTGYFFGDSGQLQILVNELSDTTDRKACLVVGYEKMLIGYLGPNSEPRFEGLHRFLLKRYRSLFLAFAMYGKGPINHVQVRQLDRDQLAHPDGRLEEYLQHGIIAGVSCRLHEELVVFIRPKKILWPLFFLRSVNVDSGGVRNTTRLHQACKKDLQRNKLAGTGDS